MCVEASIARLQKCASGLSSSRDRQTNQERGATCHTEPALTRKLGPNQAVTHPIAYGYRRIARSTATGPAHLEIYEPEAAIVLRIFTDRAAGTTVREICRRLNADRVPSPTGKATWPHSTLSRLLRSEAYVGRGLLR